MVEIIQDTYGYDLNFTITDSSLVALDLTTATSVILKVSQDKSHTTFLSATCTVDVPDAGTCHYTLTSTDFGTVGTFNYELEINFPDKSVVSKPSDQITVIEKIQ